MEPVMVDFNGTDMGIVIVLRAEIPEQAAVGTVVPCADEEGNTCDARIIEIAAEWISLRMVWETFQDGPRLANAPG